MKVSWKLDQRLALILLGLLLIAAGLLCYPKEGRQEREAGVEPGTEMERAADLPLPAAEGKLGILLSE